MDTLTQTERSQRMSPVRNKDTKPELVVRKLVHGMGYRYRLHRSDLPGQPDLVFAGRRKVIFVHGCFWHRHRDCPLARLPKSRQDFWLTKLEGNRRRDDSNRHRLKAIGWESLVVWECETTKRDKTALRTKIRAFLDGGTET